MLQKLTVRNLAIVEKVEAEFGPGLNVITGETGAGKSILMGALDLVLGGRAEASVVRDGEMEAEVEAVFDGRVIRRTVTREGRSRAWVNEESVSIAELRELGRTLVDIHGPRANQLLLEEGFQRETLDAFGGIAGGKVFAAYQTAYAALAALKAEKASLSEEMSEDQLDFLRFQVNELESAALTEEDETIEARHLAAAHAGEIAADINEITERLGGDRSAAENLAALQPTFAALARHLPVASEWAQTAEELTIGIQELSRTVADAASRLETDDSDLEALDERLAVVNRLKRKYLAKVTPGAEETPITRLLKILAEKKAKLAAFEDRDFLLAQLEKKLADADRETRAKGAALTNARQGAAQKLAKAITAELHDLGFLQARFSVLLEKTEPEAHGQDRVVYMFEPNPGEQARALASIASSGEIARVMLAVKVVTAAHDGRRSSTLVFDEIDANIGGEVGKIVGEKMRAVATGLQVVAITHLPQSAVFGARHLVVSKRVSGGRTRTQIAAVEGAARISEIARMLGGEKLTSVVKKHAEELLELSR